MLFAKLEKWKDLYFTLFFFFEISFQVPRHLPRLLDPPRHARLPRDPALRVREQRHTRVIVGSEWRRTHSPG